MAVTLFGLTFGDTGTGYATAAYGALRTAISEQWKKLRNLPGMNTAPGSFFGDMTDIAASVVDAAQQAAVGVVSQALFTQTSGTWLDLLLAPVTIRLAASASTAEVYAYGNTGGNVPVNSIVRTSPTAASFVFGAGVTIPAPAAAEAWVWEVQDFAAGGAENETFTLDVDGNVFVLVAGATDDSEDVRDYFVSQVNAALLTQVAYQAGTLPNAEPTFWAGLVREESGAGPFLTTFTCTTPALARYYQAAADTCTASQTGPIQASPQSLRYGTSFTNVIGYVNVIAAAPGRNQETDSQMKARHVLTQRQGGGNPDAIRAAVLMPAEFGGGGATYCSVEYNPSDFAIDGNLPHSIRVVVDPTAFATYPNQIAQVVWVYKAAGDGTNGTPFAVTDAEGATHLIRIDELEVVYIWCDIEVTPGEGWPPNGSPIEQVRSDVVDWINAIGAGLDVRPNDAPVSLYPDGTPRGVANFRLRLGYSTDPLGLVPPIAYLPYWPNPQPDASLCTVLITGRQVANTDITRVAAILV